MKKKLFALTMAGAVALAFFSGCSLLTGQEEREGSTSEDGKQEGVVLTVWGVEDDQEMLSEMIDSFQKENAEAADWDINLSMESEKDAKDDVLNDPESAGDVFAFADDQFDDMLNGYTLHEITLDVDTVIEENGGQDSAVVTAASKDGKLYAYPMTADNGYFMFYNKKYFKSEEDVSSLNDMLKIAEAKKKKVSMTIDDGYYILSFFAGAGLELSKGEDGTNICNWNATDGEYKGTDVAQAILDITGSKGFENVQDVEFVKGVKDGSIIAGVSGTWNAAEVEKAWGDNYAATKLPTFTCAGEQVQMASYAGYKLIGVNAYSQNAEAAMKLARYLTNYDNQVKRFKMRGLGPSNVMAADSEEVKANPAISALALQSQYATLQRVGENFWDPARTLGAILVEGNSDGEDLQELLDTAVEGITAPDD